MRATVFFAVCLSLIAVAWGNNFIIGRHLPGEVVVRDEVIVRPWIMGKPQIALCNATAPAQHVITFVAVVAWNPWSVSVRPVAGWLGTDSITVVAVGRPFQKFGIRCTILAVPKKTTTPAPTTTPASTTPETTTSTTTSAPSTTAPTPNSTTQTPSTTAPTPNSTTQTPSTTTPTPSTTTPTASTITWIPSIGTTETTDIAPMMPDSQSPSKWLRLVEDVLTGK